MSCALKVSKQFDKFTFLSIFSLGALLTFSLLFSASNPERAIKALIQENGVRGYIYNTLLLYVLSISIQVCTLLIGTLLVRRTALITKLILILPFATGSVAPASGFYILFSPQLGPFSTEWFLASPAGARLLIAIIDSWQWTGMLLFLGFTLVERIPSSQFEQAILEGISRLQRWKLVVWPMISRLLFIYAVIKLMDWLRKFEMIKFLFGEGGPDESVETFAMHAAKRYSDFGKSTYALFIALLLVIILACGLFAISRFISGPQSQEIAAARGGESRGRRSGYAMFWVLLILLFVSPLVWLSSISLQPTSVVNQTGFTLLPMSITSANFYRILADNGGFFYVNYLRSVAFFTIVSLLAIGVALNSIFQLISRPNYKKERRNLLTALSIFFLPPFAVFASISAWKSWISWPPDLIALAVSSIYTGFSFAFLLLYLILKFGFQLRYEQLVLEFSSRGRAFWTGIVRSELWTIWITFVLVFTTNWNETYLGGQWTTDWRPIAVIVGMSIDQYRMDWGGLAAGALLSMVTPVLMGIILGLPKANIIVRPSWQRISRWRFRGNADG
jgi:ABC-type sugar transport system permease subunit/ABC-type glycerol-3-phosphate transport system permease component